YYSFFGGSPESSYVGIFLQLGFVGLVLLLVLAAALLRGSAKALRLDTRMAATCIAVLATGLALGVVQSSLYSVGNTATVATWTCAFLGLALAPRPARVP